MEVGGERYAVGGLRLEVGGRTSGSWRQSLRQLEVRGLRSEVKKMVFCLKPKAKRSSNLMPLKAKRSSNLGPNAFYRLEAGASRFEVRGWRKEARFLPQTSSEAILKPDAAEGEGFCLRPKAKRSSNL